MSYTIRYSLVRILIFLACLGAFRLMGLENPLWLLLAAATVSMLISVIALDGMRNHMSEEIVERSARRQERRDARATTGDAATGTDTPAGGGGRFRRGRTDAPRVTDEDVEDQAFR